ncbi:MAG TPA: hypothetical protein VFC82_02390 [Actinomycetaceae bacterium]|nr:hypothetical protein [Actinomycetaceae bacterium]
MSLTGTMSITRSADGVTLTPDGWSHSGTPDAYGYVSVLGGGLYMPVSSPGLPRVHFADPGEGLWWVGAAFGEPVAEALRSAVGDDGDGDAPPAVVADVALTPAGASACRAAAGAWLHRWWPAANPGIPALDVPLLEIELALNAWQAEVCLGNTVIAEALLSRNLPRLTALYASIDWSVAPERLPAHGRTIGLAARAALEVCDPSRADLGELRALHAKATDSLWEHALDAWGGEAWSAAAAELRAPVALAAGSSGTDEHRTIADWALLSPRSVAGRDGDVRWSETMDPDGNAVVGVVVDAGTSPRGALWARVLHPGDDEPAAVIHLTREGSAYRGTSEPIALASGTRVEVFDPMFDRGPRTDGTAAARALRTRVLRAIDDRLAAAGRPFDADEPASPFLAELAARGALP